MTLFFSRGFSGQNTMKVSVYQGDHYLLGVPVSYQVDVEAMEAIFEGTGTWTHWTVTQWPEAYL